MYARSAEGKTMSLGVSGNLWRDALVMYDRETGSLWSQINGKAIQGQEKGKSLEKIPSRVMSWGEWRRLHPDSLVLEKPEGPTSNNYARYSSDPDRMGIFGSESPDDRLGGKEWVTGVAREGSSLAFPRAELRRVKVAQAEVGGEKIVAAWDEAGSSTIAFVARAGGKSLEFSAPGDDPRRAVDATTGSTWDLFVGTALEGPLKGTRLEQVVTTDAYWFAWASFYPQTKVWTAP